MKPGKALQLMLSHQPRFYLNDLPIAIAHDRKFWSDEEVEERKRKKLRLAIRMKE